LRLRLAIISNRARNRATLARFPRGLAGFRDRRDLSALLAGATRSRPPKKAKAALGYGSVTPSTRDGRAATTIAIAFALRERPAQVVGLPWKTIRVGRSSLASSAELRARDPSHDTKARSPSVAAEASCRPGIPNTQGNLGGLALQLRGLASAGAGRFEEAPCVNPTSRTPPYVGSVRARDAASGILCGRPPEDRGSADDRTTHGPFEEHIADVFAHCATPLVACSRDDRPPSLRDLLSSPASP